MILFPRRAGKPKKGDISDSTADRLKSAEAEKQNINKHVISKPAPKLRQKAQKITPDMLKVKVYKKIRQLTVNQKYSGKREKRAKEAAEKAQAEESKR